MNNKQLYLTQHINKTESSKLRDYVSNLQNKIRSAHWKQSLILKYNYMPLEIAKQKIQKQKQSYTKQLKNLQDRLSKQTQQQFMQQQVLYFKEFSQKLEGRMNDIEYNISIIMMSLEIRKSQVEYKKQSLKNLIKQNANLNKFIISHQPKTDRTINTKIEEKTNFERKKSTVDNINNSQKTHINKTLRNLYTLHNSREDTKDFYNQCVESLSKSLRSMNATQDIQTGIYLQIMHRKHNKRAPIYSLKSKTCDVLMDRYKDLKKSRSKQSDDFSMSLQTFLTLNWKQIMGIVLVKDRDASKLKSIL